MSVYKILEFLSNMYDRFIRIFNTDHNPEYIEIYNIDLDDKLDNDEIEYGKLKDSDPKSYTFIFLKNLPSSSKC